MLDDDVVRCTFSDAALRGTHPTSVELLHTWKYVSVVGLAHHCDRRHRGAGLRTVIPWISRVAEKGPRGFAEWRERQVTVESADYRGSRGEPCSAWHVLPRPGTPAGARSGAETRVQVSPGDCCDRGLPGTTQSRLAETAGARSGQTTDGRIDDGAVLLVWPSIRPRSPQTG